MSFVKILTLSFLTLLFVSCSEDSTSPDNNDDKNTFIDSYFPVTVGTWWEFERAQGLNVMSFVVNISEKKEIQGQEYFVEFTEGFTELFYQYEGDYLNLYKNSYTDEGVELHMRYKIIGDVGDTWEYQTRDINGFKYNKVCQILSKQTEKVVKGKKYEDILELEFITQVNQYGEWTDMGKTIYCLAKGVGIIEGKSSSTVQSILDYHID